MKRLEKTTDRAAFLSKKLRGLQIRLPESDRPIHQIQRFPEIIGHIRESAIPEFLKYSYIPTDRAVLQRLAAYLTEPVTHCLSFHFPLPEVACRLLEEDWPDWDWEEIETALDKWATKELDAVATDFIDVEKLNEWCHECIGFTRHCFPKDHADESSHYDEKIGLCWRNIGNQIAITYADFKAGRKSVCTGKWDIPQQEISDLFNRSLPTELTMVYFAYHDGHGLYVLMKTADLGRIESFY